MTTAADCHAAIQAAMAGIPRAAIAKLPANAGYAFQAYVMSAIGRGLVQRGWTWHHPGGIPTFATTNGRTLQEATTDLTYLRHRHDGRLFVQELRVQGESWATHDIDLCLVRGGLGLGQTYTHHSLVGSMVECKNLGRRVGVDVGRELLGISVDCPETGGGPRRCMVLVSAHLVAESAWYILSQHGHHLYEEARPPLLDGSGFEIACLMRFRRV